MSRQSRKSTIRILHRWGMIALGEVILALGLVAIAPIFLNSNYPLIGFLIWFLVLVMLAGSGLSLIVKLLDVQRARQLFVTKFPKHASLSWIDFLDLRTSDVAANLDMLEAAESDPDFQELQVSLIELLRRTKQR
jgi:hypothetical protein